jgi:hypothetical protein
VLLLSNSQPMYRVSMLALHLQCISKSPAVSVNTEYPIYITFKP